MLNLIKLRGGGGGGGFNTFSVDQPLPLVLPRFVRHLVVRFAWKKALSKNHRNQN